MAISTEDKKRITQILETLSSDKVKEVLDFIGYLKMKEFNSGVDIASLVLQQRSLARIWEGEEEDLYEL